MEIYLIETMRMEKLWHKKSVRVFVCVCVYTWTGELGTMCGNNA